MHHKFSHRQSSQSRRYNSRSNFKRANQKIDHSLFINQASEIINENYTPKNSFESMNLDSKIKRNITEHGYTSPTPIQDQVIPHVIEGQDIVGIANTGTGKTASFLIPLVNKNYLNRYERTLILAPTRELAIQIKDEFRYFAKGTDLDAVVCIGGTSLYSQEAKLRHNPHFVIGTPGRIKDLLKRNKLNLSLYQNIVLDEADRMVDIGFIHDIKYIISLLPKKRQSLFFSATIDKKTEEVLQNFVTDPITVSVKNQPTADTIDQNIIRVKDKSLKLDMLHDLISQEEFSKVLIFGRTKWGIEKLSKALIQRGFKAASIHGNKSQGQRQRALEGFKNGEIKVLLATDVASRGLDINEVSHVINYDEPASYEDYIHRIGRTGRAGKKGIALTFVE